MNPQVHIFGPTFSSFVRSVMLCCEEKGIKYGVGMILNGTNVAFKSAEHLQLHPFGKVPVLLHGDKALYETCTICRYLDRVFDGPVLQPREPYPRALVDQCSAVLATYVDRALVRKFLLELAFPKGEHNSVRWDVVEAAQPAVETTLQWLEGQLGSRAFIAAEEYSMADAILIPMLDYLAGVPMADELLPPGTLLHDYLLAMRQRPATRKVLASAC